MAIRMKYSDLQETILNEVTCSRDLLIDGSKLKMQNGWLVEKIL